MDVNNNIIRTIFSILNPVFLNAANVGLRCSVLNIESANVPEDIVVDWSLRYSRSATARPYTTKAIFSVDDTVNIFIVVSVCSGGHMLYMAYSIIVNSLADNDHPHQRPSLLYDHINVILRVVV